MARLAATLQVAALLELRTAAVKICLQEIRCSQEGVATMRPNVGIVSGPRWSKESSTAERSAFKSIHEGPLALEFRPRSKAAFSFVVAKALGIGLAL